MLYDTRWDRCLADPVSRQLHAAADYMEAHGWVRGKLGDGNGRVCVLGALRMVARGRATGAMERQVMALIRMPIPAWNNCICRSQGQGVAMLRAAANVA